MPRLYPRFFFLFVALLVARSLDAQTDASSIPCNQLVDHPEFLAADTLPADVSRQPATLAESLAVLDEVLNPFQKRYIACLPEEEVRESLHYSFGTWIRNAWGLWDVTPLRYHFLKRGVLHPEDMSGIILLTYYRKMNGLPLDIDKQIDYYQRYWVAQGVDVDARLESALQNMQELFPEAGKNE